jgi:hypothetical protein
MPTVKNLVSGQQMPPNRRGLAAAILVLARGGQAPRPNAFRPGGPRPRPAVRSWFAGSADE